MNIIGINNGHNASAALLSGGKLVRIAQALAVRRVEQHHTRFGRRHTLQRIAAAEFNGLGHPGALQHALGVGPQGHIGETFKLHPGEELVDPRRPDGARVPRQTGAVS